MGRIRAIDVKRGNPLVFWGTYSLWLTMDDDKRFLLGTGSQQELNCVAHLLRTAIWQDQF